MARGRRLDSSAGSSAPASSYARTMYDSEGNVSILDLSVVSGDLASKAEGNFLIPQSHHRADLRKKSARRSMVADDTQGRE